MPETTLRLKFSKSCVAAVLQQSVQIEAIGCEERGAYLACDILPAFEENNLRGIREERRLSRSRTIYHHTGSGRRLMTDPGDYGRQERGLWWGPLSLVVVVV